MNAWRRTSEALPDDETEVLGYYSSEDGPYHELLYVMSDEGGTDWLSRGGWHKSAPDWWRNLDAPEIDAPQPRPGIHYAGDGHTEPYEYRDAPRDDTDERVDDAMAEQLFEEGEQHGS